MPDQQLVDYIRKSRESGVSFDSIKNDLLSAGWTPEQIEEASRVLMPVKPDVPVPISPSVPEKKQATYKSYSSPYSILLSIVLVLSLLILSQNAVTDLLDRFAPDKNNFHDSQEYRDYNQELQKIPKFSIPQPMRLDYPSQEDYVRDYLKWGDESQKRIELRDSLLQQYQSKYEAGSVSPSFRMMLHTVIVLPFWVITFLLAASLRGERKRYEALLVSYYITSGWLLVFLFFNIARYIYDANSTLGVYVSFGMLAVVLTGAVWGIQKYRHSENQI